MVLEGVDSVVSDWGVSVSVSGAFSDWSWVSTYVSLAATWWSFRGLRISPGAVTSTSSDTSFDSIHQTAPLLYWTVAVQEHMARDNIMKCQLHYILFKLCIITM